MKTGERLIALLGVRRIGKTSLLNILFHQWDGVSVWIDGRMLTDPVRQFLPAVVHGIKNKKVVFGSITLLTFNLPGVSLSLDTSISNNEELLQSEKVLVIIDEAQLAPYDDLSRVLSYIYDRFLNVQVIVSGSEVGLLDKLINDDNLEHPLFGRHILRVVMNRLSRYKSLDFLRKGFEQVGLSISDVEIEEAVDELDGLIGWLTYYGFERAIRRNRDALSLTIKYATALVGSELQKFLSRMHRKDIYVQILKKLNRSKGWDELYEDVNSVIPMDRSVFNRALNNLISHGFVTKENLIYRLSDPLISKALGSFNF